MGFRSAVQACWHLELCSRSRIQTKLPELLKTSPCASTVMTTVNEMLVQQPWGNKDFQHKEHHMSGIARVPGQLHISTSVLVNPHLHFSFLERTPASSWVRFDNKVVMDKVQSCCLYPKFSTAYRISLWEMLNWPRFIAHVNLPSSLHKLKRNKMRLWKHVKPFVFLLCLLEVLQGTA